MTFALAMTAAQVPSAPTISVGSATQNTLTITLVTPSVEPIEGISGYAVFRSVDGTNYSQVATVAPASFPYVDTMLQGGTIYYYQVQGINASLNAYRSRSSPTVSASTSSVTPPPPTAGFVLLPNGQLNVNGGQRDLRYQPYSSASPWNTPIGTGAQYTAANFRPFPSVAFGDVTIQNGLPVWARSYNPTPITPSIFNIMSATPITTQMGNHPNLASVAILDNSSGGTVANQSCTGSGVMSSQPIDIGYFVPNTGADSQIYILPTGEALQGQSDTLWTTNYFTYCQGQGNPTGYNFPDNGNGFLKDSLGGNGQGIGTHGSTFCSALGGLLRCRNGAPELCQVNGVLQMARHALVIETSVYWLRQIAAAQASPPQTIRRNQYQAWWAYTIFDGADGSGTTAPSGEVSVYGVDNPQGTTNPTLQGSLLALPQNLNIGSSPTQPPVPGAPGNSFGLYTVPGWMLAWTLQNYGCYILDTIGEGPGFALYAEQGPTAANGGAGNDQQFNWGGSLGGIQDSAFQQSWGFSFYGFWTWTYGYSQQYPNDPNTPHKQFGAPYWLFGDDINTIFSQLAVVTNNGPNSIGGGGAPLQPLAPT